MKKKCFIFNILAKTAFILLLSILCVSSVETQDIYAVEPLDFETPGTYVPDNSAQTPSTGSGGYVWPIDVNTARSQYTSDFYDAHPAIDIAASTGTQVVAAKGGTVFCASTASASASHKCSRCGFSGAGYHVVIKQTDGKYAMYAHLSSVSVSTGASIATGKKIGAVGSTGISTGAHLHFGIYNPNSDGSINYYSYTEPLKVLTPFCNVYADNITETSAILHGQFGAISVPFASAGIYFGTTTSNMKKITDSEAYGFEYAGNNIESLFFETSKYCGQLQKGMTYYYQIWIVNSGKEYKSDIFSFTTKGCEHSYDNACDTTCNVCGYTRTISHSYKTTWSKDSSKHWHECSVCSAKKDSATHTYDNACDTSCNVCGYTRTVSHSYQTTWSNDSYIHWHECSVCGEINKDEQGLHKYDNTCDATCNICGYTRTISHSYQTTWSKNSSKHWHACSVCGAKKDEATHTYDNACDTSCNVCGYTRTISHSYQTTWSKDGSKHWHACSVCGAKNDEASHTPGTAATETKAQTCTTCGYVIKAALGHTHSYGNEWKKDMNGHWHECKCGGRSNESAHTYDSGKITKEPSVTEEGVKTYTCTACGTTKTEAMAKLPPATTDTPTIPDVTTQEQTTTPDVTTSEQTSTSDVTTPEGTTVGDETSISDTPIPGVTNTANDKGTKDKKDSAVTTIIITAVAAVLGGAGIASAVFSIIIKKHR